MEGTIKEKKLFQSASHVVLAFSGGPDSLCMYHSLKALNESLNLNLVFHPVHVNHLLRGDDAFKDQKAAEEMAAEMGDQCLVYQVDCKERARNQGMSLEEAGREIRYEILDQVAEDVAVSSGLEKKDVVIAVGQNADDRAETTLFRIMRGTGVDGISSIGYERYSNNGFKIVRPLLDVYKKDIVEYCKLSGLNPSIDKTNFQMDYARNQIRGEILPFLEQCEPKIKEMLNRLSDGASLDKAYMEKESRKVFEKAYVLSKCTARQVTLDIEVLRNTDEALLYRVMIKALGQLGFNQSVNRAHLKQMISAIMSESPSAMFNLPGGYLCRREYGFVVFEGCPNPKEVIERAVGFVEREQPLVAHVSRSWLDEHKVDESQLEIRRKMAGDYILIKGGCRKKVQDLLVDMKVPKGRRSEAVVLAFGQLVIAIATGDGRLRYSQGAKQEDEDFLNNRLTVEMSLSSC